MQSEDNVCNQQSGRTVQKDTPIPNPLSEMPLVSVLIPTHNRPEYVELALQSVLSQTYSNLEIIVSDNSDNDLTEKRLADYVRRHTHIRYIRLPSCGPLENFQTCYESAKGEYINYLMDDDLFHPEKIQIMMSYMLVKPNIGLVTSFRQLIDADGVGMPPIPGTERVFNSETLIDGRSLGAMILSNGQNIIGEPTTVLFRRRDAGEKFGCFLGRQYTTLLDVATWLSVLKQSEAVYLPEALSYFRIHGGQDQRSNGTKIKANVEWLELFCDALGNKLFLGRTAAQDLLCSKFLTSLWYLLSVRSEMDVGAEVIRRIHGVVAQAMNLLFGEVNPEPTSFDKEQSKVAAINTLGPSSSVTVLGLVQYIDANDPLLNIDEKIAIYEDWLSTSRGVDAYVAQYNLATLYQLKGGNKEAEYWYQKAIGSNRIPQARYNLGIVLEHCGRLRQALFQWKAMVNDGLADATLRTLAYQAMIRVSKRLGLQTEAEHWARESLKLNPDQPDLRMELNRLGDNLSEIPILNNQADDLVIFVVAVCFNEATILPFFLDHYINFVGAKRVFLYDGGSTDGTEQLVSNFPEVELITRRSDKLDDRELMLIRNEEWKKYRDACDWMVVCDVDEFVYHPAIRSKLLELKQQGITLPMVEGFEMLSKELPTFSKGNYIWTKIQAGTPNPQYYNKNLIFQPSIDINYTLGCHGCTPTGPVKRSEGFVFKNLHYRMLSHQYIVGKSRRAASRLSEWNKQTNAGFHYRLNAVMTDVDYNKMFIAAMNVLRPILSPMHRCSLLENLQTHLLALNSSARVLEMGVSLEPAGDGGSTEFFAWYTQNFGGLFVASDYDRRLLRHTQRELESRGLDAGQVRYLPADDLSQLNSKFSWNMLYMNCFDYFGDSEDLLWQENAALESFIRVVPYMEPGAWIVLRGIGASDQWTGKYKKLAPYLLQNEFVVQQVGDSSIFVKNS